MMEPLEIPDQNTIVIPLFDPNVQVLREEEAYSILTFVADFGGILGLFLGFNFLWSGAGLCGASRKHTVTIKIITSNDFEVHIVLSKLLIKTFE